MPVLPFEKEDRIIFYHYYFKGKKNPLVIEAVNKAQADGFLLMHIEQLPVTDGIEIINRKITTPIFAVTEKTEKDEVFVYCGKKYHETGWMNKLQFEKNNILLIEQKNS